MCALTKETQGNMKRMLQVLEKSKINVWVSTPSFAEVCLADKKFTQKIMSELEMFLFCGETLTNSTAERLQAAFPE